MRFEFGAAGPLLVRAEAVGLGLPAPVRILYASDLHLGWRWTAAVPARLLAAARSARPDLILLGGDLADRAAGLPALASLVAGLARLAPVHAVPGNHDESLGVIRVRSAVLASGGGWLPDDPVEWPVRIDATAAPGGGPRVLCAHDPLVFPAAAAVGYGLVLAGHLHGGQCVLATGLGGRLYPGAWFNGWHGLRFDDRGCRMLVSRGAADTLPLRLNCPREVLLCVVC